MTDPGTGTPLTRRAARAAAERAHSSDVAEDATAPAARPAEESAVPTTSGVTDAVAFTAAAPTRRSARPPQAPAARAAQASAGRSATAPQAPTRRAAPAPQAPLDDGPDPLTDAVVEVRHAARRRARRTRGVFTLIAAGVLLVGGTAAVTAAAYGTSTEANPRATATASVSASASPTATPPPVDAATVTTTRNPCTDPAFTAALAAHDTEAAVAAAGGGATFREEVVSGLAPCVHLDDPSFTWVVVNKQRPYSPKDYAPSTVAPAGVQVINGGSLRADAAAALSNMVAAAKQAGAGALALDSGYRSYRTQVTSYGVQVTSRGSAGADLVSARPGFSEHQSGLAGDLVACSRSCGTLDMLAGTPQDQFIVAHAWEYGWIVRYEPGHTAVTGYASEPWHLRFIGVQLAKAYHDGGFHTLEEFFGLPAAPSY